MKIAFISVVFAALTASVAGFTPLDVVPSGNNNFCKTTGATMSNPNRSSLLKAKADDDLEVVVRDMLTISSFVYTFRVIRDIVRDHGITVGDGRDCEAGKDVDHGDSPDAKKSWWPFAKEVPQVYFNRPELIITDKGAQENNKDRNFQYAVTPNAIQEFMESNRKFFTGEPGDFEFDETQTEKEEPFKFEADLKDQIEDNMKILDYVSISSYTVS